MFICGNMTLFSCPLGGSVFTFTVTYLNIPILTETKWTEFVKHKFSAASLKHNMVPGVIQF